MRLGRREHAVRVVQLEGAAQPDHPGQKVRGRAVGGRGDLRIRHGELRRRRSDDQVAREREAHPAPRGHAVDRHDHRLLGARQARHRPVQVGRQLLDEDADALGIVGEVLDVAARAEGPTRAGDHDAAHVAALVRLQRRVEEVPGQRDVQRIVGVGAVQRDGGHPVLHLVHDIVVRHCLSLSSAGLADPGGPQRRSPTRWSFKRFVVPVTHMGAPEMMTSTSSFSTVPSPSRVASTSSTISSVVSTLRMTRDSTPQ